MVHSYGEQVGTDCTEGICDGLSWSLTTGFQEREFQGAKQKCMAFYDFLNLCHPTGGVHGARIGTAILEKGPSVTVDGCLHHPCSTDEKMKVDRT